MLQFLILIFVFIHQLENTVFSAEKHTVIREIPIGYESYNIRPNVLSLQPKEHLDLGEWWGKFKKAHLETLAMLVEMYPDRELYFAARDAETFYDLARVLSVNDKNLEKRLHLLNVSRTNKDSKEIVNYLVQEGFKPGKKILFIDSGWLGTIPTHVSSLFPGLDIQSHFLCSKYPKAPSSRVFLSSMWRGAEKITPVDALDVVYNFEQITKYTNTSVGFFKDQGGVFHPISHSFLQGRQEALKYIEDMHFFAKQRETIKAWELRRKMWKELLSYLERGQIPKVILNLKKVMKENPGQGEAIVRDFIEILEINYPKASKIRLTDVGLKPAVEKGARIINHKTTSLYTNPKGEIHKLIQNGQWDQLIEAVKNASPVYEDQFLREAVQQVLEQPRLDKARIIIQAVIETRDATLLYPMVFRGFQEKYPELIRDWIMSSHFEVYEHLIPYFETADVMENKEALKTLIKRSDGLTLELIAENVFSREEVASQKDLLRLIIERGDEDTLDVLKTSVFQQPFAQKEEFKVFREALYYEVPFERANFIASKIAEGLVKPGCIYSWIIKRTRTDSSHLLKPIKQNPVKFIQLGN